MSMTLVGLFGFIVLLSILFLLGMPVGFAMAIVGFIGFSLVASFQSAVNMVGSDLWSTFSSYGLSVVPVFILLGFLAFNSGMSERLYDTTYKWVGHWRGGLAIATIAADELFAAICGSNTATVATMGTVALPQMKKYNYDDRLSSGTLATGGTLGTVMPPSVILIIIGLQTEQSIVKLFLGGILPAILLGILFVLTIFIICLIKPEYGPAGPKTGFKEKMKSLTGVIEAIAIFIVVIGGLYSGFFTPTEAGAVGVFFTFIVIVSMGRLTWKGFVHSITETLKITCMVMMLIGGAIIFGRFLAVTRLPFEIADFAAGLSVNRFVILWFILVLYLIGGCFVDALGLLVLTIPILFPLAMALNFNPIWYSIILTMVTTMGSITPPVGLNIYVVKALSPNIELVTIFKSVSFFMFACLICIVLLMIFPQIVLFIPEVMQ